MIVLPRLIGLAELKRLKLQGIKVLEPPLITMPLYHYLHKKNTSLIPRITKVLKEMDAIGRIETIRRQMIENFSSSD